MDVDPSVKDVMDIKFPSIEQDPTYGALRSLATSMSTGPSADEYRQACSTCSLYFITGTSCLTERDFLESGNVSGGDDGDAVRDGGTPRQPEAVPVKFQPRRHRR